jgi:hypothetical protein
MACDISLGRAIKCKDSVGGIAWVGFVNNGDLTGVTYDGTNTDVIETVTGTPTAYIWKTKEGSTFTENIVSSRENGTTYYEQVLELKFPNITAADHKQIKLLAWGMPLVVVGDNAGNIFIAGLERGMDVTGGTIVRGTALGDMSGYTLTLSGMEQIPANLMEATDFTTLATAGFTVTQGS